MKTLLTIMLFLLGTSFATVMAVEGPLTPELQHLAAQRALLRVVSPNFEKEMKLRIEVIRKEMAHDAINAMKTEFNREMADEMETIAFTFAVLSDWSPELYGQVEALSDRLSAGEAIAILASVQSPTVDPIIP